ncbi:MAG: hypothetical protein ACYC2Z_11170 [Candidatus Nanopelagicales bacterium]
METYTAKATREGRYWVLDVAGVGVTQARNLDEAQEMVRSLVSIMREIPDDSFEIRIRVDLAGLDVTAAAEINAAEVAELAERQASVARRQRALVLELDRAGISRRDTAVVLGVSPQRVSQLIAG